MPAAMSPGLPVRIQVQKAIANAIRLEGTLELSCLPRLQTFLLERDGEAFVRLEFERAEGGRGYLRGRIEADLVMQCQRCLGAMQHHLATDMELPLLVGSADEDGFHGIDVSDDELLLYELIEDEMILALPTVATHQEPQDCERGIAPQDYLQREDNGKRNPFAVLKQLKLNKPSTR